MLEAAAPVSPGAARLVAEQRPDAVVATSLAELGSPQTDYVRAAKAKGVPTILCVASWDNLTNQGGIRELPDLVTVWNEAQRREAVELHGVPSERVVATGAQVYDHWFEWRPSLERRAFAERVGLPPEGPFLLWLGSSPFIAPREAEFVLGWLRGLRARPEPELAGAGVLVRPHPQNAAQWEGVDLSGLGPVAVWPRGGADPVDARSKRDFFDSMYHCVAVVGVNTSALIESAIVGRPVFTLLASEFRAGQVGTLHFEHLASGGLLNVAETFDEHARQLSAALRAGPGGPELNRAFLESFVRPRGLGVPATPLLVDALESTVSAPRPAPRASPPAAAVLRLVMTPAAAVAALDARARRSLRAAVRGAVRSRWLGGAARRRLSWDDGSAGPAVADGHGILARAVVAPVLAEARAALAERPASESNGTGPVSAARTRSVA
ncbi:MAG: hypothetical protein ACR2LY_08970 [Thermoleophilaceae bacterium]